MNIFLKQHLELIEKLVTGGVDFMIIGGYAVNYYGYNRTTGDLDLWIKPENLNRERLLNVLSDLGFSKDGIETLRKSDFENPFVFSFWEKPFKVDFLTKISGVTYRDAERKKVLEKYQGVYIPFIDLQHLVISKISTSRLRDKADVEELQKIMKLKEKKK